MKKFLKKKLNAYANSLIAYSLTAYYKILKCKCPEEYSQKTVTAFHFPFSNTICYWTTTSGVMVILVITAPTVVMMKMTEKQ